jgi:hypothetical protein
MRRREFIVGLGGVTAWPIAAQAQRQVIPLIGFLSGASETATDFFQVFNNDPHFRQ